MPPYLFAEIERRIEAMRADGVDVISLGIGDPDLPTPPAVIEALERAVERPETHQYPSNRGLAAFREAVAGFYAHRFGVDIDPADEVIPVLGGKEAVAHVALACLDPGDVALAPDPGYPPYTSGPVFAGAEVHYLPLAAEHAFMPQLDAIPAATASRANLLYFNYPNNPTGAVVEDGFFARAVAFAREHDLVAVHDSAYTEIAFDGYTPAELPVDAGRDGRRRRDLLPLQGLEHDRLAHRLDRRQRRGRRALPATEDKPRLRHVRRASARRRRRSHRSARLPAGDVRGLPASPRPDDRRSRRHRDRAEPPRATPYLWIRVPEGHDSASFTELVLAQAAVIVSPGPSFGPSGEGYVRISLTVPDDRLEEAASRIASSLRVESTGIIAL